ncbi:MAG: hypothetical protein BVN31_07390 [Proteobacteria bacterium ST_bin15]|nr:MAG: hypothetical protein BVN31_07390 [Proteobacteria bacterium ST_bin15]
MLMSRPDLQSAMQAVATQRIVSAAAARPNWPSVLTSRPRPEPAAPTILASAAAAHAPLLQRSMSRRAMRRARGKAKE